MSRNAEHASFPLLAWAREYDRSFPWRAESGYRLAVAEILLQRTRGPAVEPVWIQLVKTYPTAATLATADQIEVKQIVAPLGLGQQRSERLVRMARSIDDPATPDGPSGLGSYGAGVLSLARGEMPERAPVDGNVARVISRTHGWTFERGEARKKPEVLGATHSLIAGAKPELRSDVLYALVDLGASTCKPQNPDCEACPLRPTCETGRHAA